MAKISKKPIVSSKRDAKQKKKLRNKKDGNKQQFIVTEINSKSSEKITENDMKNNDSISEINTNNSKVINNNNNNNNNMNMNNFRKQSFNNRVDNGLILLSSKIENKIYNLKKALRKKGLNGEEIRDIIRKRRRQEENKYNRDMKNCCFKCRQMGHKLSDCPLTSNDNEEGVDVCYKCGSGDHKLSECTAKGSELPFAKCFLCSRVGHLTRSCPNNKRGVYPKGGNCKHCGSVNHLIKDCPTIKEDEDNSMEITLTTLTADKTSADAEVIDIYSNENIAKEKAKLIKF